MMNYKWDYKRLKLGFRRWSRGMEQTDIRYDCLCFKISRHISLSSRNGMLPFSAKRRNESSSDTSAEPAKDTRMMQPDRIIMIVSFSSPPPGTIISSLSSFKVDKWALWIVKSRLIRRHAEDLYCIKRYFYFNNTYIHHEWKFYHAKTVKMATTRARAIAAREAPAAPETFDFHVWDSA